MDFEAKARELADVSDARHRGYPSRAASEILAALREVERQTEKRVAERCAEIVKNPPVLAFGPGGSDGTRAALEKLSGDEFMQLVDDWAEFVAAAIEQEFGVKR